MTQQIIFIGGSGRSGSTLLDRMLGQLPGFVSTGEVRDVWRAGLGEDRLCGCGVPFSRCPFWTRVGDEAFGGWSKVDAAEADAVIGTFGHVDVALRRNPVNDTQLSRTRTHLLRRLYAGISAASDGRIIVDSSKSPAYGVLLAAALDGSFSSVQLVRDSRGVAYSWGKHVRRPDTPGREVTMLRLGPTAVAARWLVHNGVMEYLSRHHTATRVRYESLLESPKHEIRRLLTDLKLGDADISAIGDDAVHLSPNHTVMGNPMRLAVGTVQLRLDDEWKARMSAIDRAQVTALTWPMLLRYGYRL